MNHKLKILAALTQGKEKQTPATPPKAKNPLAK
jgi:hypothetical protein